MRKLGNLFIISALTLLLTACGGGGGGTAASSGASAGRVLLSWYAPTSRIDSSPLNLSDLEGYRIYYGSSMDDVSTMLVDLNDNTVTEYLVSLPSGTYYFAITAYDSGGMESGLSNIINKDV